MKWLEVTKTDGEPAIINIASIAYIFERTDGTLIQCSGSTGSSGIGILARESYTQIGEMLRDLGCEFAASPMP